MDNQPFNFPEWERVKRYFNAWWSGDGIDRPMMRLIARRDTPLGDVPHPARPGTLKGFYTDPDFHAAGTRYDLSRLEYRAEAYPTCEINIGPGSMALYLGGQPVFAPDTVWFDTCVTHWRDTLELRPDNEWFTLHTDAVRRAQQLSNGDYLVTIPDIVENVDILAAMRGPEAFCYDLIDDMETVHARLDELDALYFDAYDAFYDIIKQPDGSSQYTAFSVWGPGRTAKVQCDFCALMSPAQFVKLVKPSLTKQCERLDNSVYHLDGKDAIKHLDALMDIKPLKALQWTCGAGQPDGGSEKWYPIYDTVRRAGKSLHITLSDGGAEGCMRSADALVDRFGAQALYLHFPIMSQREADAVMDRAATRWAIRR